MKWFFLFAFSCLVAGCGDRPVTQAPPEESYAVQPPDGPAQGSQSSDSSTFGESERSLTPIRKTPPNEPASHHCHRERFAVCIGINNYASGSGYANLKYAGEDAIQLAEAFLEKCGFEHVLLLTDGGTKADLEKRLKKSPSTKSIVVNTDVTHDNIEKEVRRFLAKATAEDDLIVFFFSGHGDSTKSGNGLLATADYHPDHVEAHIELSEAFGYLNRHPIMAQNRLLILDTCRSGHAMQIGFSQALDKEKIHSVILASCEKEQASYESENLQHGRFSWALLESFNRPIDSSNWLWVGDISRHIKKQFKDRNWGNQNPRSSGQDPRIIPIGSFSEPDYFTLHCPAPESTSQPPGKEVLKVLEDAHEAYIANRLEASLQQYAQAMPAVNSVVSAVLAGREREVAEELNLPNLNVRQWAGTKIAEYARVLYRLGHIRQANHEIARAGDYAPQSSALMEVRGYRDLDAGQYATASEQLAAAFQSTAPQDRTAFLEVSQGLVKSRLGDYQAAAEHFAVAEAAVEKQPRELTYARLKINAFMRAGEWDKTIPALDNYREKLIAQGADPQRDLRLAIAHDALAETLWALKRHDDAAKEAKEGRKIRINNFGSEGPLMINNEGTAVQHFPDAAKQREILIDSSRPIRSSDIDQLLNQRKAL